MASYQTLPVTEEQALQKSSKPYKLVAGVTLAAFVLGAVAATAVGSTSTAAMDLHGSTTKISDAHISNIASGKCLTVNSRDDLELAKCGTGNGKGHHSKQRFNYEYKTGSGQINYRDGKRFDVVSVDAECWDAEQTPCPVMLWREDKSMKNEQNIYWDPATKRIQSHKDGGNKVCMTAMSSTKVLWKPCGSGHTTDSQKWQIGDAPSPPSGGACNKYCLKDSDCSWFGGANSCTKCDTTPGTRFKCVPP